MSDAAQSSHTASTATVEESLALRLPVELWLDILSRLDYVQLHKARRICKKFNELVQDPSLDDLLFRCKPVGLEPQVRLALHPILDRIEGIVWEPRCAMIRRDLDNDWYGEHDWNAFDYPATQDFATSPACTDLLVCFAHGSDARVKNSDGVTVLDFITKLSLFWTGLSEPLPPGQPRKQGEPPYDPHDELEDQIGWNGWEEYPWMREDGIVQMSAHYFDF
ncbi:hypothetical protein JCM10207_002573 [Rhodosporidiobolus poonsookiae]